MDSAGRTYRASARASGAAEPVASPNVKSQEPQEPSGGLHKAGQGTCGER
jgi:hypothetical protein